MMENKIEIIFTDEGISVKPIGEINSLRAIQGMFALVGKINELADVVNELQKHTDRLSCAILDLATPDGENKALKSIQAEPKTPTENVQDKFAEQRKWIGCLVRYKICDWQGGWHTDVLDDIVDHPIYPFKMRNGQTAQVCELVTADEIYPNKARTW